VDGAYRSEAVAVLDDRGCRFLNAGDVDGDGRIEVIASTMKKGIRLLRPGELPWPSEIVDARSSGFEHATVLHDFDGDGAAEIYVADDDDERIRRYRWRENRWEKSDLYDTGPAKLTFSIAAGRH